MWYIYEHVFVRDMQWRIQEFCSQYAVAFPGILFGRGLINSVEGRGQTERGSGGGSPLVRGSGGSCNLVQEISFHIVKFFLIFGTLRLFMITTNLFVIANVKQLQTDGSFRILLTFPRTSWGVGVLNSAIFNSFHNRVEFGTILKGLWNLGGGGCPPQTPQPTVNLYFVWHPATRQTERHARYFTFIHNIFGLKPQPGFRQSWRSFFVFSWFLLHPYSQMTDTHRPSVRKYSVPQYTNFHDVTLLFISSWIEFWLVTVVPKYLNPSTLSKEPLPVFILWLCPAFWSRDMTMYLVFYIIHLVFILPRAESFFRS